jgi:hypothetical protein
MKKLILYIGLALAASSCIENRVDLLRTKTITLNEVVPPEIKISTSIYEDKGNLVVLGRLGRGSLDSRNIPGHIDIVVLTTEGEELAVIKAQFRSLPTWRHGPNPVAFRVELPGIPPLGSTVQVKYHVSQH